MTNANSKLISLIIAPMITGSVSFAASLTLIISIMRSNLKLSNTYRRIVFALSIFDLLQSLSQLASSLPMPAGSIWGAIGNDVSCDLQGFLTVAGFTGSILYSLSLTIYFLLVVKFNLPEAQIKKRYEPFLHAVPILLSCSASILTYATHNYNPTGVICWIAPEPGVSKLNANILKWVVIGAPTYIVFSLNCIMLGIMWWTVSSQVKKSNAYRGSWATSGPTTSNEGNKILKWFRRGVFSNKKAANEIPTNPLAARLSRPSPASIHRMKQISYRALGYVVGFSLTYVFTMIYRIIQMSTDDVPFWLVFLSRLLFPLQGNKCLCTYLSIYQELKLTH